MELALPCASTRRTARPPQMTVPRILLQAPQARTPRAPPATRLHTRRGTERLTWSLPSRLLLWSSTSVNRLRLCEERMQDVIYRQVIDLLETRMRDARHHRELLVGVRQTLEKLNQIVETCDAVEFAAHDERRHSDLLRIHYGQLRAHVDIGARRHRIVEREHRIGECLDHMCVGGPGMIAIKNAAQKIAVDRPPVYFQELRQFLAPLFERRAAFAGPHEGVEREPRDALRMALREHRRAH